MDAPRPAEVGDGRIDALGHQVVDDVPVKHLFHGQAKDAAIAAQGEDQAV